MDFIAFFDDYRGSLGGDWGCDGLSGILYGHVCIVTVCKEYGPPRATLAAVLRDPYTVDTTKPVSGCTPPHLSICSLSSSSLTAFLLGDAFSTTLFQRLVVLGPAEAPVKDAPLLPK